MAGQNDFLVFDENKENILTQENYSNDTDRLIGFKEGLARSIVHNKAFHQVTSMVSAIGEAIKDNGLVASDSLTTSQLKDNFNSIIGLRVYSEEATFPQNVWVIGTLEGKKGIFNSLIDGNKGNPLSDITKWKEIELGGANVDLSNLSTTGKNVIDGNFIPPLVLNYIVNGVTIQGASNRTYDISSYLPDDGQQYLVLFFLQHNSQASATVYLEGTGDVSATVSMQARTQVTNQACTNNGFVLIGSNRVLRVSTASLAVKNLIIGINAIRRVGINL